MQSAPIRFNGDFLYGKGQSLATILEAWGPDAAQNVAGLERRIKTCFPQDIRVHYEHRFDESQKAYDNKVDRVTISRRAGGFPPVVIERGILSTSPGHRRWEGFALWDKQIGAKHFVSAILDVAEAFRNFKYPLPDKRFNPQFIRPDTDAFERAQKNGRII